MRKLVLLIIALLCAGLPSLATAQTITGDVGVSTQNVDSQP